MTSHSDTERVPVMLDAETAAMVDKLPKEITPMRKAEDEPKPEPKKVYHVPRSVYKDIMRKPKAPKKYEEMTATDLARMEAAEAKRSRKENRK